MKYLKVRTLWIFIGKNRFLYSIFIYIYIFFFNLGPGLLMTFAPNQQLSCCIECDILHSRTMSLLGTPRSTVDLCLQTMCSFCFTVSQIKNAWLSLMNVFLNSRNTRLNQLRKKYHEEYYFGKKSLMLLQ